jgi:hypothetical protein
LTLHTVIRNLESGTETESYSTFTKVQCVA